MKRLLVNLMIGMSVVSLSAVAAPPAKKRSSMTKTYESRTDTIPEGSYGMAGCGLGSLAIRDGSKWMQVVAATLNGTGVQTFGISFGTSNCTEDGVATAAREKEAFIE